MILSVKEIGNPEFCDSVLEIICVNEIAEFTEITNTYHVRCKFAEDGNHLIPMVDHINGGITFNEDGTIEHHDTIMMDIGECFAVWNAMRRYDHPLAAKGYVLKMLE